MDSSAIEFASPQRKLVSFFQESRDGWKAKHHQVKAELKLARNQIRAVEKSRDKWKQDAQQAGHQVKRLEAELDALKSVLV